MNHGHGIAYYAVLLTILVVVLFGGFTYGFLSSESRIGPYPAAKRAFEWARHQPAVRRVYLFLSGRPTDATDLVKGSWFRIPEDEPSAGEGSKPGGHDFQAVGYLSGYEPASGMKGVTVHVKGRAYEGLNLIVSGHGQEALLIDMEGKTLHRWTYRFGDAFPEHSHIESDDPDDPFYRDFWRRCHLHANGDLLAIYEGFGIIKLDKHSNLIWAVHNGCHHDIYVTPDSLIYVLTHEVSKATDIGGHGKVSEDFISILDHDGNELRRVSVHKALRESDYASYLQRAYPIVDVFHTNTLQVLDGTSAGSSHVFRKGNVLTSMRNLDVVAVIDMVEEEVVWALSGLWRAQHEPTLLANGNMLVFDNVGHGGMSKVIEFDPLTQEIVWSYEGTPENGFYTQASGAAHRLPNGNTLIVESNSGRAFEVTRDGLIVWEYYNPHRAGEDDELIATLFDVVRLSAGFPTDWLDTRP